MTLFENFKSISKIKIIVSFENQTKLIADPCNILRIIYFRRNRCA